jgi:hypothetical protein
MTQERERIGGGAVVVLVRRALVALTAIGILATAFELATVQHWHDFEQLIPWVALLVLAMATVLVLLPGRWATAAAWVLALLVLGASTYGVIEHTLVNYESGALDQRFADTWETLPSTQRWGYAITKTVGPSPTLAPGILAQSAVLLFLASLINPRRRSGEIQSR